MLKNTHASESLKHKLLSYAVEGGIAKELVELYQQTPAERHSEIIVSGDRLFFDGEEYVVCSNGEVNLVRSQKNT